MRRRRRRRRGGSAHHRLGRRSELPARRARLGDPVALALPDGRGREEEIALPPSVIEDRFLCAPGEGAAWMFAGDCTKGRVGGGFLYTNSDSISLGLVATLSDLAAAARLPIYQMLEDFKQHAAVAPLVMGGASWSSTPGTWCPKAATAWFRAVRVDGCWWAARRPCCA